MKNLVKSRWRLGRPRSSDAFSQPLDRLQPRKPPHPVRRQVLALGAGSVLAGVASAATVATGASNAADAVSAASPDARIAFVYVSPVPDAGWTYQHDLGRRAVESALGERIQTRVVADVAEGADAERVIRDLATQGFDLVFATSFGYMEPVLRVARDHPEVRFEHAGGYRQTGNVATYNARFYEGRYLAGMLAGGMSRSNTLGYVAGMPIPEVIQGINAFMIGARHVNPSAELRVIWTNAWFDPGREKAAANTLISAGADVLSHHTGSSAVPRAAEAAGVWVVGYTSDMSRAAPGHHLVSVTHHWGDYYTERVRALLEGRWRSHDVWGSMKEGFVRLQGISDKVPTPLLAKLQRSREALLAGELRVFTGAIRDNQNLLRVSSNKTLSDSEISSMNWFAEGVRSGQSAK